MERIKLSLVGTLANLSIVAGFGNFINTYRYKTEPWRMMNNQPWQKNKKRRKT